VGHAAGQAADRLHLLGLPQLVLAPPQLLGALPDPLLELGVQRLELRVRLLELARALEDLDLERALPGFEPGEVGDVLDPVDDPEQPPRHRARGC
jgi:hypothetical protein